MKRERMCFITNYSFLVNYFFSHRKNFSFIRFIVRHTSA
jgi:hypothetical protein